MWGPCFQGQPITFSEEAFLGQKPGAPLQAFHRRAVHLQLFKQVRAESVGAGLRAEPWGAAQTWGVAGDGVSGCGLGAPLGWGWRGSQGIPHFRVLR